MTKPIHIFRSGTHAASSGAVVSFSDTDLAGIASSYDPKAHEAPIVVGHPKTNAPAYGWIGGVKCEGGDLYAAPHQVNADFADLVRQGAYKKVSASFFMPGHPNHPVPGSPHPYLRHVGFLGGQPPAIKGLAPVEFADAPETATVELTFDDLDPGTVASVFRSIRDWLIGRFGQDEADKVIPSWTADYLQAQAAQPDPDEPSAGPAFSDPSREQPVTTKPGQQTADFAEREAALATREATIARQEAEFRRRSNSDFLDGLIQAGKFLVAKKAETLAFMDALGTDLVVEFADEAGKSTKKSPLDSFKDLLGSAARVIEFGEIAGGTGPGGHPATVEFAAPSGFSVDGEALALHAKALDYQRQHPNTDYLAAVAAVGGK